MLSDSHIHLNRHEFAADRDAVIARAVAAGVVGFLEVGYDLESSEQAVALAATDPRVYAAVGVHPHDADSLADCSGAVTPSGERVLERLEALAGAPRVVAIGEIGLDFYRDLAPRPSQMAAFCAQLALAKRLGLPVILHVRDAYRETLEAIDRTGLPGRRGVLHAFSGDEHVVRWACARGFRVGIGGPVTYKNSHLRALLPHCDPAALLLETDAPWLPPVPHRGRRNEPAYLPLVAEAVGDTLGLTIDEVAELTTRNFREVFALPMSDGIGDQVPRAGQPLGPEALKRRPQA